MDLHLAGKKALVTGGTRGIGRATVEAFIREGAAVGFCARDPGEVEATEAVLSERGDKVLGSVLDVADADRLAAWVRQAGERLGGIDIVVSNVSALAIPDSEDNWAASLAVDLMGAVRLINAAVPYLEASATPSIITVSSVSGREIDFAAGPYGTAKAALVHYTQGLAYQFAAKGIRANSVSPGNTFFEGGVWDTIKKDNPSLYDHALRLNPTGRMGTPQEMAAAIVFLASPVSSFTSGTNLVVDGALAREGSSIEPRERFVAGGRARELATRDAVMAALVAAAGPPRLRPPGETHFAALVRAIVYQQLAGAAAAAIHGRLVAAMGDNTDPETLLALPAEQLRAVGLSANKAASLRDLADKVLDGTVVLNPRGLSRESDDEVVARLSTVRGIGQWTAQMFLMFQLRRLDVWPTGDLGVRRGYGLAWRVPMPTARELEPLGEPFRPYRSVTAWYCWRACEIYAGAGDSAVTR